MVDMILFPSSYFDTSKVDEDLQKEYEAVLATGLFNTAVFGYDNSMMNTSRRTKLPEPHTHTFSYS